MRYFLPVTLLMLVMTIPAKAIAYTPKVVPTHDIYIPLGETKRLARAIPTARYSYIKTATRNHLILFKSGTNLTVGMIPKTDQRRSPTAYLEGRKLVVRPGVSTYIYRGFIPYDKGKRYDVVSDTKAGYKAKFTHGDFTAICVLAKTSVVYFSEADIRAEHEATERDRQMRVLQAKITAERAYQQQIQEKEKEEEKEVEREWIQKAKQEEWERAYKAEEAERERVRQMSLQAIKAREYISGTKDLKAMRGLNMQQVKDLLGPPDSARNQTETFSLPGGVMNDKVFTSLLQYKIYTYFNKIFDPHTESTETLRLWFGIDEKYPLGSLGYVEIGLNSRESLLWIE